MLMRQQAAIAIGHQHDHDRIGARKPLQTAGPAFAAPTTIPDQGGAPAMAAALGVLMPLRQRTSLA